MSFRPATSPGFVVSPPPLHSVTEPGHEQTEILSQRWRSSTRANAALNTFQAVGGIVATGRAPWPEGWPQPDSTAIEFRSMAGSLQNFMMRLVNFYPPFLGAGIRVTYPKDDPYTIVVTMRLRLYNRNLFGTHFGGSLYMMADPFFVFVVTKNVGPGYHVWDKKATIEFLKPGRGRVTGRYHVPPEEIARLKGLADAGETVEPVYTAEIVSDDGTLVARVTKTLWVRKKTG